MRRIWNVAGYSERQCEKKRSGLAKQTEITIQSPFCVILHILTDIFARNKTVRSDFKEMIVNFHLCQKSVYGFSINHIFLIPIQWHNFNLHMDLNKHRMQFVVKTET